jgi:hypothetical protein
MFSQGGMPPLKVENRTTMSLRVTSSSLLAEFVKVIRSEAKNLTWASRFPILGF